MTQELSIWLIETENPKRRGSKAYERYALYHDGMTVTEARAAGLTTADFDWDQEHGYIRFERVMRVLYAEGHFLFGRTDEELADKLWSVHPWRGETLAGFMREYSDYQWTGYSIDIRYDTPENFITDLVARGLAAYLQDCSRTPSLPVHDVNPGGDR